MLKFVRTLFESKSRARVAHPVLGELQLQNGAKGPTLLIWAARATLSLALLSVVLNVAARTREDELIAMKVEAHASLHTHISLKEWCERKYPETGVLAGKVGLYLYPRMGKVEGYLFSPDRNPDFRRFLEEKFKNRIAQGRDQDIAHFESKYTQQMCLNALKHIVATGIGQKLETYVEMER
jgi:hypothetical protein